MSAKGKGSAAQSGIMASRRKGRERRSGSDLVPSQLVVDALQHGQHRVVFGEDAVNGESRICVERLQFAQEKQSEYVIDVGVEKNHAADRGMSNRVVVGLRVQFGSGFDL